MIKVRTVAVTTTPAPVSTGAGQVTVYGDGNTFFGGPDVNITDKGTVAPVAGLPFPVSRVDDIVWARTATGTGSALVVETGIG